MTIVQKKPSEMSAATVAAYKAALSINGMKEVNVADYGATGDGTEQATEIQAAIDACGLNSVLTFPAGEYLVSTSLAISGKGDFSIRGENSIIKIGSSSASFKLFDIGILDGLRVENLKIDMTLKTVVQYGMYVDGVKGSSIFEKVNFYNFGNHLSIGLYLENVGKDSTLVGFDHNPGAIVTNCTFFNYREVALADYDYQSNNSRGIGLKMGDNAEYGRVTACSFKNIVCGVWSYGGANWTINGCEFNGIDARDEEASTGAEFGCIYLEDGALNNGKMSIVGNKFNHNWAYSIRNNYVHSVRPIDIIGNHFLANMYTSIAIIDLDRCLIMGNLFNRAYDYITVLNYPYTGVKNFILFNDVKKAIVKDNQFVDQDGDAILSLSTSDSIIVKDNIYSDVTGSFTVLAGSSNVVADNISN